MGATKIDYKRFDRLQKHFAILNKFDDDALDELDWSISDTLYLDKEENEKLINLFKELKSLIDDSKIQCITESKKFLTTINQNQKNNGRRQKFD